MIKALVILSLVAVAFAAPRTRFARSRPTRIIGGTVASPHEFPFMLSLQYFGSHVCGAAIIRANAVVTSGHCADIGPASSLTVKAGKHHIHEIESTEQTRQIASIHIHPDFPGTNGFANDIAVLKTTTNFVFTAAVAPVPLAPTQHVAIGNAAILGWGVTEEGSGSYPDLLQKGEVPIVSDADCRAAYGPAQIDDNMICAGLAQGGVDSCTADAGGPLTATDRGFRYLAGVTSFGFGCAKPGYPGVYSEIAFHNEFINENAS